ncbi:hypothetical protein ACMHYK_14685 [Candidatus Enterenecus avicola]
MTNRIGGGQVRGAVSYTSQDSDLTFRQIEEVLEAVCTVHNGAYAAVIQFVENNGYRITGPFRESYIDGIWNKESEEEWLTEIQLPVEKISRRISLTNRLAPSKLKAEKQEKKVMAPAYLLLFLR